MRSLNSIKNTIISFTMNMINILAVFIAQRIFIKTLGKEYLGLNGLFNDIISFLSIAELGFSSAIIYSMYKPIAENNKEEIKSLMYFYKKVYQIVGCVVASIGILIIPFLNKIVGETSLNVNIYYIYALFLFEAVSSYFISYKRSILYANQQAYLINLAHIAYIIFSNISQLLVLIHLKSYVLYLIIRIIFKLLENFLIAFLANKLYPFITERNYTPIANEKQHDIFKKVYGLLFHKIGSVGINATDNIITSCFLGLSTVGLYNNYLTMATGISVFITHIFCALTSSIGNLLLEKNFDKSYNIYKTLYLFDFWLYTFASIGFVCLGQQFISIWVGEEYLLSFSFLIVFGIKFFITGIENVFNAFKDAAGIFYENRFVPIYETIVNIIASVILVNLLGINGILLGTIISSLVLFLYSYPKHIYTKLFNKDLKTYYQEQFSHVLLFLIVYFVSILITLNITLTNFWINVILKLLVVILIPNIAYLLVFHKSDEFKYYINLIKMFIKRVLKKTADT